MTNGKVSDSIGESSAVINEMSIHDVVRWSPLTCRGQHEGIMKMLSRSVMVIDALAARNNVQEDIR